MKNLRRIITIILTITFFLSLGKNASAASAERKFVVDLGLSYSEDGTQDETGETSETHDIVDLSFGYKFKSDLVLGVRYYRSRSTKTESQSVTTVSNQAITTTEILSGSGLHMGHRKLRIVW